MLLEDLIYFLRETAIQINVGTIFSPMLWISVIQYKDDQLKLLFVFNACYLLRPKNFKLALFFDVSVTSN